MPKTWKCVQTKSKNCHNHNNTQYTQKSKNEVFQSSGYNTTYAHETQEIQYEDGSDDAHAKLMRM